MKRIAVGFVAVALIMSGCSDDTSSDPPADDGFVGTIPFYGSDISWSPAHQVPASTRDEIEDGLGRLATLIPSEAPIDDPTTARATFSTFGTTSPGVSADATEASIRVEADGLGTLAIVVSPAPYLWCGEDAPALTVRGTEGCGAEGQVWWVEAGREFYASFGDSVPLDIGIEWLESWTLVVG